MSVDHIDEAQGVQDPERALDLIRGVLQEHMDVSTAIRQIHEVLDALPGHVGDVKTDVGALLAQQAAQDAKRDTILRGLDEMRVLLQTARDEAAAGHEIQKIRLREEQEERKRAAVEADITAKKREAAAAEREAAAAEKGAKWKERAAIGVAVVMSVIAFLKELLDFFGEGP